MRRALLSAGIAVFACVAALGQSEGAPAFGQSGAKPTFEVASVRPAPPVPLTGGVYFGPARGGPGTSDPGQIAWSYASMKAMLLIAFDAKNYQINGPAWLDTERYDVALRVPAGTTVEQARVMWRNLLAERFGLTVHHESKEFQVQELTIGKGGAKLKETSWDAAAALPEGPPKIEKGALLSPGNVITVFPDPSGMHARMVGRAQPVSKLTEVLSNTLGHPVLDKTGLTGKYDYTLDYAMSLQLPPGAPVPAPARPADGAGEPGPDLAAAVQQQLGLALVAGKANLEVVVIDHLNKIPTEN